VTKSEHSNIYSLYRI